MAEKLSENDVRQRLVRLHGWEGDGNRSIHRAFSFSDHIEAVGFVVRVAMVAEVLNHHPDLHMVYNRVELTLSTHDAGGVTEKDFDLAHRIASIS